MQDDVSEKLILTIPLVRIDQPLYLALAQQAASVDRPMAYVVRQALRDYLAAHGRIVGADVEESK